MLSILVFFIVLSSLVLIHELGHFLVAKKNDVCVEEFGFGLPPRVWGIKIGETVYSINLLPFGGFVKVLGEERHELTGSKLNPKMQQRTFASKKPLTKIAILTAGVVANFILGWLVISALFIRGVPVPTDNVVIESVASQSPAQSAGLLPQDTILSFAVDNHPYSFKNPDQLGKLIDKHKGKMVTMTIKRDDRQFSTSATPRQTPPKGQGSLGIVITQFKIVTYPFYSALFFGLIEAAKITGLIVREFGRTIFQLVSFQPVSVEVAGPIGIAKITSDAVKFGFTAVLQLLSLLSLNLAVINILPFPSLDGGRVALVLYEWVTQKPLNPKFERKLNYVGFAILISLIVMVTVNDIVKILN